jgi:nitrite reductase/ring-hydroxylating ferredoxin subunit
VPPNSSAKNRATYHMAVNVAALLAFVVGWFFRDWSSLTPGWAVVVLEAVGVGLVTWGGYMGGTLVYRNQIGVDHRYAEAGKWREATVEGAPGQSVVVAKADELKVDQIKLLRVGDRRIVLARTEGGYVAFDDRCTHRGGSLAGGVMTCGTVACPWHGSQFDVRTGAVKAGPAEQPIGTYRVEQAGGEVRLTVPPGESLQPEAPTREGAGASGS